MRLTPTRLLPLLVFVACASSHSQFPTSDELRTLAERPITKMPAPGAIADVDTWDLAGPFPAVLGDTPATATGPAATILKRVEDSLEGRAVVSEQAQCAARELGRFHARHKASPSHSLRQFIASRCGLISGSAFTSGYRYVENSNRPVDTLTAEWGETLATAMRKSVDAGGGARTIGLSIAEIDGTTLASWVTVPRKARIRPLPPIPDGKGRVVIKGELLVPADHVEAMVNRGPNGVGTCLVDPRIKPPHFAVSCEPDTADGSALIQVLAFPPGRILGPTVAMARVSPNATNPATFRKSGLADLRASDSDPTAALAALVTAARSRAGLSPLTLNPDQSRVATALAPHYYAALADLVPETVADQVVLGMRAGWNVGVPLRSGDFASGEHTGPASPPTLIADILETPRGRMALLDPAANQLAIGVVAGKEQGFLGAIFGTYEAFTPGTNLAAADAVWNRIHAARSKMGLPTALRLDNVQGDLAAVAASVSTGELSPDDGMQIALGRAMQRTQRASHGFHISTHDLANAQIPAEILMANPLHLAVGVGDHKDTFEPWHRYVVYFVMAIPDELSAIPAVGASDGEGD